MANSNTQKLTQIQEKAVDKEVKKQVNENRLQ